MPSAPHSTKVSKHPVRISTSWNSLPGERSRWRKPWKNFPDDLKGGNTMSEETKKVLQRVASGQITADDAEKLLEKLGGSGAAPRTPAASGDAAGTAQKLSF